MQNTCTKMKEDLSSNGSEASEMLEHANLMQERRYEKKKEPRPLIY